MNSDITDVLRDEYPTDDGKAWWTPGPGGAKQILAALAAATADGPLVGDAPCGTCGGEGWRQVEPDAHGRSIIDCPACHGDGTVRLVVHRADPALAERLNATADRMDYEWERNKAFACSPGEANDLRAAARISGGES
jgi:hypothetical protein